MLGSVQFRLKLTLGAPLGAGYEAHFPSLYLILLGAVTVITSGAYLLRSRGFIGRHFNPSRQFRLLIVSVGIAAVAILLLLPDLSKLQMVYFVTMALALGIFLILIPGRLRQGTTRNISLLDNLQQIREHRYLVRVWAGYRIRARYTQTFLGVLWIVLAPILESLVMAFAFSQLLGRGERGGVPWVLFLLSGRVAFLIFQRIVIQSNTAIQRMGAIIQQVYFPRELIVMLLSTETVVDFLFAFAGFVVIALFYGLMPNIYYLLLPIPIILMVLLAMGVGFIIAWLGLLIRDIQHVVAIGMQLLFYVTVLFDSTNATSALRFLPLINPVSAMVEATRNIVLYAQPPDVVSLYFPAVLSLALLYTGYVFYKVNEDRFTDYL